MSETDGRLELRVADLAPRAVYSWLTSALIPRAIAWVATVSADGVDNLAPHSFTTVASVRPPTLCFTSVGTKDTLRNVRETGEFVLHVGSAPALEVMNDTATDFPHGHSEFAATGLVREPSAAVRPGRVAVAPVAFECRASGEHAIGDSVLVFGEVVHLAVARSVLAADGLPDARALDPLARLGRSEWSTLGEVVDLPRVDYSDWTRGARSGRPRADPS